MTMSSGILESFLRNDLHTNKNKHDTLRFEEFLEYSRSVCGLLKMNQDPRKILLKDIKSRLHGNHAVILFEDQLFYHDKRTTRKLERNNEKGADYDALKSKCKNSYKLAKEYELELVISVTGRSFSQHRSNDFLTSLNFYLELLDNTDKVLFSYMTEEQKEELRYRLRITLLLLRAQCQHEIDYQKTENRIVYNEKMRQCNELLDALNTTNSEQVAGASLDKPLKYLGMSLGQELGQHLSEWMEGSSKKLKHYMGRLNEKRLYWVWGSSFLKTVIDLVPKDYYNGQQAHEAIRTPDPYTGYLSWTLYYFRFSLHLFLLLKHTIKGPWMSKEEAKSPWYERFQIQWAQRKFNLLNDSLWGTANLVTFFWFTGKGLLGVIGDALTLVLLVFDTSVAIWDFEEQKTQFNKQMLQYAKDIRRLKAIMAQQVNGESLRHMKIQLHDLEQVKAKCEKEWRIQKLSLINNMAYALALMLAFGVLTMPFIPVAASAALILGIIGAVLCLAFTVINNAIRGALELYKTHENIKVNKEAISFTLLRDHSALSDNEKKVLFFESMKLKAELKYQEQVYTYQLAHLVRRILFEVCTPAILFSSLVFLPVGGLLPLGLFAVSAVLALVVAIGSKLLVNAVFQPEKKEALTHNEEPLLAKKPKNMCFFNQYSSKNEIDLEMPSITPCRIAS